MSLSDEFGKPLRVSPSLIYLYMVDRVIDGNEQYVSTLLFRNWQLGVLETCEISVSSGEV